MRKLSLLAAICAAIVPVSTASAVVIDFNNGALVITDNGIGDTNLAFDVIDFNTTVGGYLLQGTVDTGAGTNLTNLIGVPNGSVRLTNFIGEATANGLGQLDIQFSHTVLGTYAGVIAADSLDAYVSHATAAPVPAGNDLINIWQGFVNGIVITPTVPGPPPYLNPNLPASSPPLPYPVVTQGPMALTPLITNPAFGAYFSFDLGSAGDQLLLFSSAEVGFSAVPEPGTVVLFGLALAGLPILRRRLKK